MINGAFRGIVEMYDYEKWLVDKSFNNFNPVTHFLIDYLITR
jgi:hypothetical protein